jgi:hypothetical protein
MPVLGSNVEGLKEYLFNELGRIYLGSTPVQLGTGPTFISASGGTITTSGNYKIHTFTNTGSSTFTVDSLSPSGFNNIEYLIVGGGGGGGASTSPGFGVALTAGGGGAGGTVRTGSLTITNTGSITVTVGDGGIGGFYNNQAPPNYQGPPGDPGISSSFSNVSASGGGGGPKNGINGEQSGGSNDNYQGGYLSFTGSQPPGLSGAGGAGNTENGFNAVSQSLGANGGAGIASSINGTTTYYGGGGGGGGTISYGSTPGTGGIGGGGTDSTGSANTGGGGAGFGGTNGFKGGSGIVIVRYQYKE